MIYIYIYIYIYIFPFVCHKLAENFGYRKEKLKDTIEVIRRRTGILKDRQFERKRTKDKQ